MFPLLFLNTQLGSEKSYHIVWKLFLKFFQCATYSQMTFLNKGKKAGNLVEGGKITNKKDDIQIRSSKFENRRLDQLVSKWTIVLL